MDKEKASAESNFFVPDGVSLVETVLARIKKVENFQRDAQVATILRVTTGTLANWKKRQTVPYETIVEYARSQRISLEWLLNGNTPVFIQKLGIAEEGAVYRVQTDQDAVYEIAERVFTAIQRQTQQVAPHKFRELVRLLHRDWLAEAKLPHADKVDSMVKLLI